MYEKMIMTNMNSLAPSLPLTIKQLYIQLLADNTDTKCHTKHNSIEKHRIVNPFLESGAKTITSFGVISTQWQRRLLHTQMEYCTD